MKRTSTIAALVGSLTMASAFGVACSHNKRAAPDRSPALEPPLGTSTAMGPTDPTHSTEVPQTPAPPLEPVPTLTPPPTGEPVTVPAPIEHRSPAPSTTAPPA